MSNIVHTQLPQVEAPSQAIMTTAEYKALRGIDNTDRDAQITAALPGAEDAVVRYAQRAFNQAPAADTRSFVYEGQSILEVDDCQTVTAVKFDGVPVDPESYILGPQGIGSVFYYVELLDYPFAAYNPYIDPFLVNTNVERRGRRRRIVEVTATFGWPAVPASVAQAVAFLVDDFAGDDRPGGQDLTAESIVDYSRVWNQENTNEPAILPPKVRQLLDPFRRVLL